MGLTQRQLAERLDLDASAEGMDLPTLPETDQRYLTHGQLHRVAVASGRLRTLILVLGYCGLRFGEAAALTVANVDTAARRIRVRRSVTYVPGKGLVEGPTKGKQSRAVPVPEFLARLLETELAGRGDKDLAFPSARGGGWLTLGQGRYAFQKATAAVDGCEGVRLCTICGTRAPAWPSSRAPTSKLFRSS